MTTLSFEPAAEWYAEGGRIMCATSGGCTEKPTIHAERTGGGDGESWPLCTQHAVEMAGEQMEWVAANGAAEPPAPPGETGPGQR